MRGQAVFFGKAQCATCHQAPYYTDGLMHNLQVERFFNPVMINGMMGPSSACSRRGHYVARKGITVGVTTAWLIAGQTMANARGITLALPHAGSCRARFDPGNSRTH